MILLKVLQGGGKFFRHFSINSNPSCPIRLRDNGRREYVPELGNTINLFRSICLPAQERFPQ